MLIYIVHMYIYIYIHTRVDLCIPCTELVANCMPEEEVQLQRNPPPPHPPHPNYPTPPTPPQLTPQASASLRSRTPVPRNPADSWGFSKPTSETAWHALLWPRNPADTWGIAYPIASKPQQNPKLPGTPATPIPPVPRNPTDSWGSLMR